MSEHIFLYLDESGNLGKAGRYFTIAAIETTNVKPLMNVMKKTVLKAKQRFTKFQNAKEIKASDSSAIVKEYFLRKIASKDIHIRYIVADKKQVKKELLDDENLLYNYMLKFLIVPVAKTKGLKKLVINLDKRSIKVKSSNSFEDYIKIVLRYEMGLNIEIIVNYVESHNCYAIQASDFVANATYTKYEHNYDLFSKVIEKRIVFRDYYPA